MKFLQKAILLAVSIAFVLPFSCYADDDDVSMLMSKLKITTNASVRQEIYAQLCALYRNEADEVPERVMAINDANEKGLKAMAVKNAAYICRNYYYRNMLDSMSVWIRYVSAHRAESSSAYFYAKYFEMMALLDRDCCHIAIKEANSLKNEAVKSGDVTGRILMCELLGNAYKKCRNFSSAATAYGEALSVLTDATQIDAEQVEVLFLSQPKMLMSIGRYDEAVAVLNRFSSMLNRNVMVKYDGYESKPGKYTWVLSKLYAECYLKKGDKVKSEQYYQQLIIDSDKENNKGDLDFNYLRALYFAQKNELEDALDEIDYVLARTTNIDLDYLIFKSNLQKRMGDDKGAVATYKTVCDSLRRSYSQYLANDVRMMSSGNNPNVLNYLPQETIAEQSSAIGKYLDVIIAFAIVLLLMSVIFYLRHNSIGKKLAVTNKVLASEKSELEKVTSNLEKAYSEAEQSNVKRNEFLETLSHEIRTPLNSIVGFSDMIVESEEEADEAEKEYVNIIRMNSDLMLKLVNDILDLSQLDSAGVTVDIAPADVKELAQKVLNAIKPLVKPGVKVSFSCDEGEWSIYTDHYRLQQLLTNLLGNAAKFTTSGEINLNIKHCKSYIRFSITDTGCGIAEEDRGRVFKRYEKLDESAKGTGLGLYISMLISRKLGGKIYLDENYVNGARFVFEHPVRLQFGQRLISDNDENDKEVENV